ncbi:S1C family serine protease [Thalassoroseus pseudoceratinae]|uniref:S1C family serine protease n=1 Tax=Thalassoroseus pseudoceratinae TaxID=2713176 RepID=UPI0014230454|nr:trypsin-like peptidase domain-containing protein [Thalassoroseus pseudoceratinae]
MGTQTGHYTSPFRRLLQSCLLLAGLCLCPTLGSAEEALRPAFYKNAPAFRSAFSRVVADVNTSVVRVISDERQRALGTIVDASGYILTKASELRGDIEVELRNGKTYAADLVGIEEDYDLAMLKITADNLSAVSWAAEETIEAGQWFVSPGMDDSPSSIGVVSVPLRKLPPARGILGIGIENTPDGTTQITTIYPNSGAERAGLRVGDVVSRVAGKSIRSADALATEIGSHRPGEIIDLEVTRNEKSLTIRARLGQAEPRMLFDRQRFQNRMGGKLSRRRTGFPTVIQHDSVLDPQECGGPVLDISGNVIGLNIARAGRIESYSVPASIVLSLLDDLKSGKLRPETPDEQLVSEKADPIDDVK